MRAPEVNRTDINLEKISFILAFSTDYIALNGFRERSSFNPLLS